MYTEVKPEVWLTVKIWIGDRLDQEFTYNLTAWTIEFYLALLLQRQQEDHPLAVIRIEATEQTGVRHQVGT